MKMNEVYLRHILDAIEQIRTYTDGVDRTTFEHETMRQNSHIAPTLRSLWTTHSPTFSRRRLERLLRRTPGRPTSNFR